MQGWISIYREIQDHWIWQDGKHLKWWLSILLNVNHQEKQFPVGLELFTCKPGQSFKSIEQWTAMFGCSKKTTIRFFEMLEKEGMIEREILGKGNRRKHLLTVANWEKFQKKETEKETETVPKNTPKQYPNVTPNNNANNGNNENNENKNIPLTPKRGKSQPIIDLAFVPEDFKDIVENWLQYKAEKKQKYKGQRAIRTFLKHLLELSDNDPRKATKIIDQSIANNWAGIFELKNKTNGRKPTNLEPSTADELARDFV